jgi:4'-phosphopantetheinyl transferase
VPRPAALALGGRIIHLGWATAKDAPFGDLPPQERALLSARAVPHRKETFAAGRWAARRALAAIFPSGSFLVLRELDGPFEGRPTLVPACGVSVSISHSGGLAVAGASPGGFFGLDLETREPAGAAFVAEAFAPGELQAVTRALGPTGEAPARAAWALKEAMLKVWGIGLRAPLAQVAVRPSAPRLVDGSWHFEARVVAGPLPSALPPPPPTLHCALVSLGQAGVLLAAAHPSETSTGEAGQR